MLDAMAVLNSMTNKVYTNQVDVDARGVPVVELLVLGPPAYY